MTPFISKKHILLISNPSWTIFMALDALGVEIKKNLKLKNNKTITKYL
jgi:hypothetical protein